MFGAVVLALSAGATSCGGSSEPSGDQAAAAEVYIRIYSPSNPDCVTKEHKKVDNETATLLLQAYEAYEAYAAIDDAVEQKLTAALNKCALG